MIGRLIAAGLRFRLLVLAIAAVLVVAGIGHLHGAPVDVLPEYQLPTVEIQTESLGLSAAEVEQLITVPLEQDLLNGVKGVDTIRSDSVPGLSKIVLVFERGTDILRARQLVQERLSQPHAFPSVSKPPQMLQPVSAANRVMMIGLSTSKLSAIQLSVLARWTVRPRLMGIPGVANVAIWGHRDRQLQVQVDPERLRAHNVSLRQVIETTGNSQLVSPLSFLDASTPGTGGFLDGPNQRLSVRHILPFGTPSDLGRVPLEESGLRLGQVANVVEDHQPLIGDAVVDGGSGLLLVVEKLPGTNTLEVTRKLDDALAELRQGLAGVTIDASVFRPATFIESAMGNLRLLLAVMGALVVIALAAFLLQWRAVLVAALAIPLSLLAAALVLSVTGATFNALVVAGLAAALAVIVDDALGDVHAIVRRIGERRARGGEMPAVSAVLEASLAMRRPMAYATLVVLVAAAPVFFTGGLTGAFVHPMALAYALAVLASMVVALTVTPTLGLLLLSKTPRPRRQPPLLPALAASYDRVLSRLVRTPRTLLLAVAAIAIAGIALLPLLGEAFRPSFKDRELLVHFDATPSTSLGEMDRITSRAASELRSVPGVSKVGAHLGRAVSGDQTVGTGSAELWVSLDASAGYDTSLASIRDVVDGYPGLRGRVLTYENERSQGVFAPADNGLTVRVYGQELGVLHRKADELRAILAHVDGVRDPRVLTPTVQPTLEVEADIAAARRHGIKPGDVRRAVATLVSGLEVGNFFEQQKVFSVVVRGTPATTHSVDSVRALLLDSPNGGHARLGDVAHVRIKPNPVDIRHDAVSRYMDVRAGVAGRDLGSVRRDVQRRLRQLAFPLEYHAELLGTPPDERSGQSFLAVAIASAIGVFLLLQAAFGSWRLAALVFAGLPVALAGGLLVAFAGGGKLALGEAAGLFAVLALAARNGIALVMRVQALQEEGLRRPGLVRRAARERFAPATATAALVALAFLPPALLGDVAGNEITHSMALVVLGGLVTSTLLALVVAPGLLLHYGGPGIASEPPARTRAARARPPSISPT